MGQHMQQHEQAAQNSQQGETAPSAPAGAAQAAQNQPDLISQVQSNAQRTSDVISAQTQG
jgi:hypothetical protein